MGIDPNEVVALIGILASGRMAVIGSNKYSASDSKGAVLYGVGAFVCFWGAILFLKYTPI